MYLNEGKSCTGVTVMVKEEIYMNNTKPLEFHGFAVQLAIFSKILRSHGEP